MKGVEPVGQRIILLAQDADEHDEGLQAGRGDLQVISISVAGEAALKQVHGLERGSNGVVVRVGGVAEGVGALIIHNRRLGGDGKHGGGFLSHQIPVAGCKGTATGNGGPCGDIHHSAGVERDLHTARQQQDARAGGAGQGVACLQTASIHVAARLSRKRRPSPFSSAWSEASSFSSTRWSTASVKKCGVR